MDDNAENYDKYLSVKQDSSTTDDLLAKLKELQEVDTPIDRIVKEIKGKVFMPV
jgi:hypothetical protein